MGASSASLNEQERRSGRIQDCREERMQGGSLHTKAEPLANRGDGWERERRQREHERKRIRREKAGERNAREFQLNGAATRVGLSWRMSNANLYKFFGKFASEERNKEKEKEETNRCDKRARREICASEVKEWFLFELFALIALED